MSEPIVEKTLEQKKAPKMPWVIPVFCDGCAGCVNRCKSGVLEMTETNIDGVYVPWLSEPSRCNGCGRCAQTCAMGAITMTSYVSDATKRFIEKQPSINS